MFKCPELQNTLSHSAALYPSKFFIKDVAILTVVVVIIIF
jgi:hypothetical protein